MLTNKFALNHIFGVSRLIPSGSFFATKTNEEHNKRLPRGYNAPTAFSLYVKTNYTEKVPVAQVMPKLVENWKNMDPSDKLNYERDAKSIAKERRLTFEQLPDEEKFNLSERQKLAEIERINRARRKVIRNRNASTNRPKVPPNGYAIYIQQLFKNSPVHTLSEGSQLVLNGAKSWKSLPQSEKAKFDEDAQKRREAYNLALEEWKANVKKLETNVLTKLSKMKVSKSKNAPSKKVVEASKKDVEKSPPKKAVEGSKKLDKNE